MAKLKEGDKAPDFAVTDGEGNPVRLKDLRGKKFVLYFYPKDDTPGCTKEACSFRDSFAKFKKRGIEVFGVSLDSEKAHQKFAKKYDLPFRLLADTELPSITLVTCYPFYYIGNAPQRYIVAGSYQWSSET